MQALSAGPIDVPALLGAFRDSHPLLEVHLRHAANGSVELAGQLRDGRIDVAILSLPEGAPPGVTISPLATEPMVLVCAPGHRFAARRSLRLAEVAGEEFIDHPGGWGTRVAVDRAFAVAGLGRRVAYEVADTPSVINLISHGLGVAILPPSIVPVGAGVRQVAVRGHSPQWDVALALPANRPVTAAARAFAAAGRAVGAAAG
jgi:DNA-binding transcriptional LysR family regulator